MGPTPPGHHHRMLSEGMALITPGVLTERSSSHIRSVQQVPYNMESFNRVNKYVIHSNNQIPHGVHNDVTLPMSLKL